MVEIKLDDGRHVSTIFAHLERNWTADNPDL